MTTSTSRTQAQHRSDATAPPENGAPRPESTGDEPPVLRITRQRHWGRWVAAVLVVFLLAQLLWSLVTTENYHWDVFAKYLFDDAILDGLVLTLQLTAVSIIGGFILGGVLAVFRLSGSVVLNVAASGYIWFFRSVPVLVQILIWYNLGYLYPTLGLGTPFTGNHWIAEVDTTALISAWFAAALGLTLHQAAYSSEIIRGGILSVDSGQWEAARALGIPAGRRFFRIILPQAARSIVPNAFNELISQIKGTSVVFIVALPELFYTVQVIYNRTSTPIPLLMVSVAWYALFTTTLTIIQFYVERHYAKGADRNLPPTPLARARSGIVRWWHSLEDDPADIEAREEKKRLKKAEKAKKAGDRS